MIIDSIFTSLLIFGIILLVSLIGWLFERFSDEIGNDNICIQTKNFVKKNPHWVLLYLLMLSVTETVFQDILNTNEDDGRPFMLSFLLVSLCFYKFSINKKTRYIRDSLAETLNDSRVKKDQSELKDKLIQLANGDCRIVMRLAKADIVLLIRLIDSESDIFDPDIELPYSRNIFILRSKIDPIIQDQLRKMYRKDKKYLESVIEENPSFVRLFEKKHKQFMRS